MSSPLSLLSRRFKMHAISDGVSCLRCQKTDSWRADSRPPVLEQCASSAWRNSTNSYSAWKWKEQEEADVVVDRQSRRRSGRRREKNKLLTKLLKMPERQRERDRERDLFDNVYPEEEQILLHFKTICSFSVFSLLRTLCCCSLIPICN